MNSIRAGAWLIAGAWAALAGCTGQPLPAPESAETDPKPYDDEVEAPAIANEIETPEGVAVEMDELPDGMPATE